MKTISTDELTQKKASMKDLTIINTLPQEYFEKYKIPGSINVPQDQNDFVERVLTAVMNNKDAEIVVYCANQECDSSSQAARKLNDAGFTNVYDFEGGAQAWHESENSVESN